MYPFRKKGITFQKLLLDFLVRINNYLENIHSTSYSINIEVKPKELVAIVGHVGCGKSSLMSALLGEMEKSKGYVGFRVNILSYIADSLNPYRIHLFVLFNRDTSK